MAYQPKWVRGKETPGDRDCAARYEAIWSVVAPYTRTTTVWDIGANLGYFGLRLAHDAGCVSVMVDSRPQLIDSCRENDLPTTVAITHRLSVKDLQELSASEAPDVVLALNVLHHFDDWQGALDAVLALGDRLVIETPGRGDTGSANYVEAMKLLDAIEALQPMRLASFPSHVTPGIQRPLFLIDRVKDRLTSSYAYVERVRVRGKHPVRAHRILRDFSVKAIAYQGGEARDWHPGINLWNWVQFGGAWPDRSSVMGAVRDAHAGLLEPHGDFRPWNLILQGQRVVPIDGGHRRSVSDDVGLKTTLDWIAHQELARVK